MTEEQRAAGRFLYWLKRRLTIAGRGDDDTVLDIEPSGRFWLGRLVSETYVANLGLGDRGERLEPCATGLRVRPVGDGPWRFFVVVSAVLWLWQRQFRNWQKSELIRETIEVEVRPDLAVQIFGRDRLSATLARTAGGSNCLSAEVRVEVEAHADGSHEMAIMLVLYECQLIVHGLQSLPFILEALPDSFRYDRRVPPMASIAGPTFYRTADLRQTIRFKSPR